MRIFGITSIILFAFCFIPQIIVIYRTKNVSGISLGLWVMVILGYVTGLAYVISLWKPVLIATYLIGLIFSTWVTTLVIYYRNKKS